LTQEDELRLKNMQVEIDKLFAETTKLNKDLKWYEITIIIAGTLAVVAIAKLAL